MSRHRRARHIRPTIGRMGRVDGMRARTAAGEREPVTYEVRCAGQAPRFALARLGGVLA